MQAGKGQISRFSESQRLLQSPAKAVVSIAMTTAFLLLLRKGGHSEGAATGAISKHVFLFRFDAGGSKRAELMWAIEGE
jgi:hypothetical protein